MIERTQRYLRHLTRENERVMVPSVVVGEYLSAFAADERQRQLESLSNNFYVPAFDALSAATAAELQAVGVAIREPGARNAFKADAQIIATAICSGASLIVTANVEEFRRIAQRRIQISDIPDIPEQADLLGPHPTLPPTRSGSPVLGTNISAALPAPKALKKPDEN